MFAKLSKTLRTSVGKWNRVDPTFSDQTAIRLLETKSRKEPLAIDEQILLAHLRREAKIREAK